LREDCSTRSNVAAFHCDQDKAGVVVGTGLFSSLKPRNLLEDFGVELDEKVWFRKCAERAVCFVVMSRVIRSVGERMNRENEPEQTGGLRLGG